MLMVQNTDSNRCFLDTISCSFCELFITELSKHVLFITQTAYTAHGLVLRRFIVHKGNIPLVIKYRLRESVGFIKTDDGDFDYNCIGRVLKSVYRFNTVLFGTIKIVN